MNKEKFGEGTLLGYLVFAQFKAYSALFGRGGRGGVEEKMWFHSPFSLPPFPPCLLKRRLLIYESKYLLLTLAFAHFKAAAPYENDSCLSHAL